jgi:hypothetical protein
MRLQPAWKPRAERAAIGKSARNRGSRNQSPPHIISAR